MTYSFILKYYSLYVVKFKIGGYMVTSLALSLNGVDFNLTEFLPLTSNMDNLSSLENIMKLTDSVKNSIESIKYPIDKPLRIPFIPFASPHYYG